MTTKRLMVYDNPLDPEIQSVELAGETPDGDFSVTRDLSVGRDARIASDADINGKLDVAGNTTLRAAVSVLGASLNVSNNVVAGSDVTSGNDVTAVRDIAASRDLRAARDLAVTRNASVLGDAGITGALQAQSVSAVAGMDCDTLTVDSVATIAGANVTNFGIGAGARSTTQAAIPDSADPTTNAILAVMRTFRLIAT